MIKPMKGGPASVNPVAKMAPKERKAFQARIDYLRDLYRQREAQRAKQARKKK